MLPFLLTFTWPQFKAAEVLWTAFKSENEELFQERMTALNMEISQTQPSIESIPQVHVSCIAFVITFASNLFEIADQGLDIEDFRSGLTITYFIISFVLSVISSSYGLSNFLVNGPKIVQKPLGSMILFMSILTNLVGKAVWLALIMEGPAKEKNLILIAWFGFSNVPNMILQFGL